MCQKYKNKNPLKNLPFYSKEIKRFKKKIKKFSYIKLLSELHFFTKEPKELTNIQLSNIQLSIFFRKIKKTKKT